MLETMVTTERQAVTGKPYEEFAQVKAAILIDRIYIPIVVSMGVVGNLLCFVTLVFTSLRTTSTCVFMAAIAVLDCVILVLDLCVLIRGYLGHAEFYIRNDWACGFHNFLFYFAIHFDVLLLLAMTVDRFIVVKFPLKAQSLCTPKSALTTISALGVFSLGLNGHILFHRRLGSTGNAEQSLKCWYPDADVDHFMRRIYTWIDASIYSFIPFLSLLVLNILIIRQLRQSRKFSKQFTHRRDGKTIASKTKTVVDGDTYSNSNRNAYTTTPNTNVSMSDVRSGGMMDDTKAVTAISKEKPGSDGDDGGGANCSKKAVANASITVMLLLVSFTFLMFTSPVVTVLLYKRYHWLPSTNAQKARARLTHAFVDNLMYTNHAVNFILYCVSGQRFRTELKRLLARFGCRQ